MTPDRTVIFVPLALNQAEFYADVARELRAHGIGTAFITFHEPSLEFLIGQGVRALSAFTLMEQGSAPSAAEVESVAAEFGIDNVQRLLSHEKMAYEQRDGLALGRKLVSYLRAMRRGFTQLSAEAGGSVTVVQELGGFLSVAAGFYAARSLGITNTFIEPSFFRGRVLFVRDSLEAYKVHGSRPVTAPVREYLRETMEQQQIVIPQKDKHHYQHPIGKLLRGRHVRRLVDKVISKHVRGEREEFQYIGGHVARHVRMAATATRLRLHYDTLADVGRYVYYPLHVPADVALTVRSPEYLDQYALLDYLARNIPVTHTLVVKEHPAMIGAVRYGRMADLLRRNDNIRLLHPGINNYDVLRGADAVVTVNSKAGAESLLLGRQVIALGDAFYRETPLVHHVPTLADVPARLHAVLGVPGPSLDQAMEFFQVVWDESFAGELYSRAPGAAAVFTESLVRALLPVWASSGAAVSDTGRGGTAGVGRP